MITSRVTSKSQTTIPLPVRRALGLQAGDEVVYVIEDGRVVLSRAEKARADIFDDPFATFTEWDSEADHKAYDKL